MGLFSSLKRILFSPRVSRFSSLMPSQMSYLNSILRQATPGAMDFYKNLYQNSSPESFQNFYNQSFLAPAQKQLEQTIIPTIKNSFLGGQELGNSALNRALSQSASDLTTNLGSQMWNMYNQNIGHQLQGLGNLNSLSSFSPYHMVGGKSLFENGLDILSSPFALGSKLNPFNWF